jgi:two-component system, cell cycle sensor histidine kinase and response regulator CckA
MTGRERGRVRASDTSSDALQQNRAGAVQRDNEEIHRLILENTLDLIALIDQTGRYVYASPSHLDVLGYQPAELIGSPFFEFVHPLDRAALMEQWPPVAGKAISQTMLRVYHAEGAWRSFETSSRIVMRQGEPHVVWLARDITAQQQSGRALIRLHRHHELILTSAGEGIFGLDRNGHTTFANPAAARLLGWESVDLLGQPMHALIHHTKPDGTTYPEADCPIFATLTEGRVYHLTDDVFWRKDGTSFPIEYTSTPIYEGRMITGAVVVFRNIRARKDLEARLLHTQKMDSIGRLAGGVAHDFNNLLTVIIGNADLAKLALPADALGRGELGEIKRAALRATNLTGQLLAFARKQVIKPRIVNLNDLLLDMDKLLRRLIDEDIELITLPSVDLGLIKADPSQLEQVIVNLAVNARDAMPEGGKLTLATANVIIDQASVPELTASPTGAYVLLTISDTGMGMSEDVKARAFEPFFTTKAPGRGTGLGLATCYGIITQQGGHIQIDSQVGQGTTMSIYLPLVEATADELSQQQDEATLPLGQETLLLVEDEPSVRALARRVLREQGYSVLEAANGDEALQLARQQVGLVIDLVVTDVVMPQMSGIALANQLKDIYPTIKILFTSGYTDDAIMRHAQLQAGAVFLPKPFSPATLACTVREVLDSSI